MASLAVPVSAVDGPDGNLKTAYRDVTMSNSYTTGGEAIAPAQVGMQVIYQAVCDDAKANNFVSYNYSTNKLMAFVSSTGAEVANATDLSAVPAIRVGFRGR